MNRGLIPRNNPEEKNFIINLVDVHLTLNSGAGQINILRGINLQILAGQKISLVGPSGAGKSTLLMIVSGLESATSGLVEVVGQNLSTMTEDELALFRRHNIGIVFQSFHLIPTMTALENVSIPLELAGISNSFNLARDCLNLVGLHHRAHHYPSQLSGGEQQRVAIARAFVGKPKLLLADEPTGNLDQETGEVVMQSLFQLQRLHNTTLLLITHDEMLADKCDQIIKMTDGYIRN